MTASELDFDKPSEKEYDSYAIVIENVTDLSKEDNEITIKDEVIEITYTSIKYKGSL